MNIVDLIIIIILLVGGLIGAKNGFFKQTITLVGTIFCFIMAWALKSRIGAFLSLHLPFFNFDGPFTGLTSLNIIMYELIGFLILLAVFSSILGILIKITGLFEKFLKMTVILAIPSKILGFILGIIETYIIIFACLLFLKQPAVNLEIINESKLTPLIVNTSPVLSNVAKNINNSIKDIYKITEDYIENKNENDINNKIVNNLLENNVIKEEYLTKLIEKDKIEYKEGEKEND